jgi:hypothetical protein
MPAGNIKYFVSPGQPSFDEAVPQGQPSYETPFQEDSPNHIVINQVYMQRADFYSRPADNTRCPPEISRGAIAYFCADSARVPVGAADLLTWTRTWATKPASFIEYQQLAVQIPARGAVFRFDIGTGGGSFNWYPYLLAKSYSLPRSASILHDFFLVGTNSAGITCDYSVVTSIPALNETIYTGKDVTSLGAGPLSDDQFFGITAQNIGLFSGAVLDPNANNGGTGNLTFTASALTSGDYYVGQSTVRRYLGNIWERVSTRITI